MGPFTCCLNMWDFMDLYFVFHGHVGPCRMCRLYSDIALGVYICMMFTTNPCVAGCRCLCLFLCVGSVSDLVENELNL